MAARSLPPRIAGRRKTMFRANMSGTFLGPDRPGWVDRLLSPGSLRAAGYFDPDAVARGRLALARRLGLSPRRFLLDVGLTSVVTTQLWHHLYCGGGLCELTTWAPTRRPTHREQPVPADSRDGSGSDRVFLAIRSPGGAPVRSQRDVQVFWPGRRVFGYDAAAGRRLSDPGLLAAKAPPEPPLWELLVARRLVRWGAG